MDSLSRRTKAAQSKALGLQSFSECFSCNKVFKQSYPYLHKLVLICFIFILGQNNVAYHRRLTAFRDLFYTFIQPYANPRLNPVCV